MVLSVRLIAHFGSPPRVRGKRVVAVAPSRAGRLTPACAGKTGTIGRGGPRGRAHPRVCGENGVFVRIFSSARGSPPRVRGKREHAHQGMLGARLTPACAGKTSSTTSAAGASPAHPRVCGENAVLVTAVDEGEGSPPRVRGKLSAPSSSCRRTRLTPACAGKTARRLSEIVDNGAHPRVCGENANMLIRECWERGSPPRVRGKRPRRPRPPGRRRLTPACAGKTGSS